MDNFISCNVCESNVDGIGYKTKCCHLLCPLCATKAFTSGTSCPKCGDTLNEVDVEEIEIGSKQVEKVQSMLLRHIFRSRNWKAICDNYSQLISSMNQCYQFISTQLIQQTNNSKKYYQQLCEETQKRDDALENIQKQHALIIHQTHQKLSTFEDELAKKDEELSELKLAYKEKMRKCTAWEKAYNSLRCQLSDGHPNAPSNENEAPLSSNLLNQNSTVLPSSYDHNQPSSSSNNKHDSSGDGGLDDQGGIFKAKYVRRTEVTTIRQNNNNQNSGRFVGNSFENTGGGNDNNGSSGRFISNSNDNQASYGYKPNNWYANSTANKPANASGTRRFENDAVPTIYPNYNSYYGNNSNSNSNNSAMLGNSTYQHNSNNSGLGNDSAWKYQQQHQLQQQPKQFPSQIQKQPANRNNTGSHKFFTDI